MQIFFNFLYRAMFSQHKILIFFFIFNLLAVSSLAEELIPSSLFKEKNGDSYLSSRIKILNQQLKSEKYSDLVRFADELFENEDYYNALTLYKYALFKARSKKDTEGLRFRIALCYQMGERWNEAESSYDDFIAHYPNSTLAPEASYRTGQGFFQGKKYIPAINHFNETIKQFPQSEYSMRSQYALGLTYARLGKWKLSQEELKKLSQKDPNHPLSKQAQGVISLLDQGETIPEKSPWLAGTLSLIPGLGKVYTHHYGGAIIAALINGGLAFVIYDSFNNDRIAVGAVFSAVFVATYSANLVGGYRSANRYNARQEDKFADQVFNKGYVPELGLE